jgi:hypothetical protein
MKTLRSLIGPAATAISVSLVTPAHAVTFDFKFFDRAGNAIGIGFMSFEEIAPNTRAQFEDLLEFEWGFSIPVLGIDMGSPTEVAGIDPHREGIELEGALGSRSLSLFDDDVRLIAFGIPSVDMIVFDGEDTDRFLTDDGTTRRERGTFEAVERVAPVPLPPGLLLFGSMLFPIAMLRWRSSRHMEAAPTRRHNRTHNV